MPDSILYGMSAGEAVRVASPDRVPVPVPVAAPTPARRGTPVRAGLRGVGGESPAPREAGERGKGTLDTGDAEPLHVVRKDLRAAG
jgi:hypothetical protein